MRDLLIYFTVHYLSLQQSTIHGRSLTSSRMPLSTLKRPASMVSSVSTLIWSITHILTSILGWPFLQFMEQTVISFTNFSTIPPIYAPINGEGASRIVPASAWKYSKSWLKSLARTFQWNSAHAGDITTLGMYRSCLRWKRQFKLTLYKACLFKKLWTLTRTSFPKQTSWSSPTSISLDTPLHLMLSSTVRCPSCLSITW